MTCRHGVTQAIPRHVCVWHCHLCSSLPTSDHQNSLCPTLYPPHTQTPPLHGVRRAGKELDTALHHAHQEQGRRRSSSLSSLSSSSFSSLSSSDGPYRPRLTASPRVARGVRIRLVVRLGAVKEMLRLMLWQSQWLSRLQHVRSPRIAPVQRWRFRGATPIAISFVRTVTGSHAQSCRIMATAVIV